MAKKILVTKLILPGGLEIPLVPPAEFIEGEPLPFALTFDGRPIINVCIQLEWAEVAVGEDDSHV